MTVGRSEELARLDGVLDDAASGRTATALLVGDPGMGTTALLEAAGQAAADRGFAVVMARPPIGSAEYAFDLAHDLHRSLWSAWEGLLSLQRPPYRSALVDSEQRLAVVSTLIRDLIEDITQRTPLLLGLDDAHHADDDSLAAVTLAVGRLPRARLAVIGTSRPVSLSDPRLSSRRRLLGWQQIDVGPLVETAAVDLLQSTLDVPIPAIRARHVVRALGCCPGAIIECQRLLTDEQLQGRAPLPDPLPLHVRMQDAWLEAIDRLPRRSARCLLALSVLDSNRADVIREVFGRVGCGSADLEPAAAEGILAWVPIHTPTVKPLARAAVLAQASPSDVQAMHRVVLATADRVGAVPAVLIRHLRLSADPGDEQAILELERLAQRAHELDQPEVAARGWEAAARLTSDPALRSGRAIEAARIWLSEATAAERGEDLLMLLDDCDLSHADTVWRDWLRAEVLADTDVAASALATTVAARRARRAEPSLVPWLLWSAAISAWDADDPTLAMKAAADLATWSEENPGHQPAGVPSWLAPALHGTALVQSGQVALGVRLLRAAVERARVWRIDPDTPLPELVNVVALDELMLTDGDACDVRLESLLARLADDHGASMAAALVTRGRRAQRRGDWGTARTAAEKALELCRALGSTTLERSALGLHVELDALTGSADLPAASRQLRDLAGAVGDHRARAIADRACGLAALAVGDVDEAVVCLESAATTRCLGRGIRDTPLAARVDLVEAYVRVGARGSAGRTVAALSRVLPELGDADATAALYRCRALVDPTVARCELERAVSAHERGSDRFEAARTRLLLGQHWRRHHQPSRARLDLSRAAQAFACLGARPWQRLADAEARTGGREADRPHAAGPLGELTAQERRVARAVAEGLTNREVAQALVLSPRTVEFHLGNAYRKLGVSGRTSLARLVVGSDAPAHRARTAQ